MTDPRRGGRGAGPHAPAPRAGRAAGYIRSRPTLPHAVVAAALAGCVSAAGILAERGTGELRCYRVSYDTLWPAAAAALRWTGLVLERADRENGFFVAHSYEPPARSPEEMAVQSDQGERVAVILGTAAPEVWTVEVLSRPIFELDLTAKDWTEEVFLALEDRLPTTARDPHPDLARCVRERATPLRPDSSPPTGPRPVSRLRTPARRP
ncbi:MAG: hypothetical protein ACRELC_14175 [Gemmatimonadota bacterium]